MSTISLSCPLQGSVFSALLTDMMEAVRWSGASTGGKQFVWPSADLVSNHWNTSSQSC